MAKLGELINTINGRLTLTSGVPVTTSDVTAATSVYFTPYKGNNLSLYNTEFEEWRFYEFSELTLSLSGYTADYNYDIFVYESSGAPTLESLIWTNDTTRATALATQDGIYVKSGDTTRRYLGTIRTTGTIGQCEDSALRRYCWNLYNGTQRMMYDDTWTPTGWTYNGGWRPSNNDSARRVEYVIGLSLDVVHIEHAVRCQPQNGEYAELGVGINSTSALGTYCLSLFFGNWVGGSIDASIRGIYSGYPDIGYTYAIALEKASGTVQFYAGATRGIMGRVVG